VPDANSELRRTFRRLSDAVATKQAECLGLEKHPEKTFIGRVERGFDFLGYHFSKAGLSVAKQTVINFIQKASPLYEQGRCTPPGVSPAEMYARRWLAWVTGGFTRKSNGGYDEQPAPLCRSIMQLREQPNGSCLFCGEHATKQANHRLPK
jgi:hypothetical protein